MLERGEEIKVKNQYKTFKILIAEDDEVSEMLLEIAIRTLSKDVLVVRNGMDAVGACRCNPDIDLILMDIQMPGLDGLEATRQIRQFNKEVIIIAQTAYVYTEAREMVMKAGCNDYIGKPIYKVSLLELMKKHLQFQLD